MLCDAKYYADGFDYRKMITDKGIVIKGYSEFVPENLERMKSCSKSFWNEGLCLVIPSENKDQKEVKLICYNDSYTLFPIQPKLFSIKTILYCFILHYHLNFCQFFSKNSSVHRPFYFQYQNIIFCY